MKTSLFLIAFVLLASPTLLRADDQEEEYEEIESFEAFEIETLPETAPEPTVVERLGRFHVPAVHFPIGWLTLAFLAALARLRFDRLGDADLWILTAALPALGLALGTGLIHEESREGQPAIHDLLENHETWAFITVGVAALAFVLRAIAYRKKSDRLRIAAALVLALGALAIGWTGHLGGSLVFGENFLWGP